jgi:hypothetical protein
MIELADIFRRFGGDYLDKYGNSILYSHQRAIDAITNCRTESLGGHLYGCTKCDTQIFAYHSCKNRHCPKCHTGQTTRWLEQRQTEMLPTPYFHITATIPESLRTIFRSNQEDCYAILMRATADAILELARDPKHIGGTVGILMLLHTWTGQLIFHPHAHCLVTAGGISNDGHTWSPARPGFLIPSRPLSRLIRGKVMTAIKKKRPDIILPENAWRQEWVVKCLPWEAGEKGILNYLARYAYRIAITNRRILAIDQDTVTFSYKDRKKRRWRKCQVSGEEFMRRFLQHVLPGGFHKIRYFGLWHHTKRNIAKQIRVSLELEQTLPDKMPTEEQKPDQDHQAQGSSKIYPDAVCPACKCGQLIILKKLPKRFATLTSGGP